MNAHPPFLDGAFVASSIVPKYRAGIGGEPTSAGLYIPVKNAVACSPDYEVKSLDAPSQILFSLP